MSGEQIIPITAHLKGSFIIAAEEGGEEDEASETKDFAAGLRIWLRLKSDMV